MSNGASGLELLAQERDKVLLGEVAAWLHDWQKCIPFWKRLGTTFNPGDVSSVLENCKPAILLASDPSLSLKQIIEDGRNPNTKPKYPHDWRIRLLRNCHRVAHIDKPELVGLGEPTTLIGSVFGYEISPSEASRKLLNAVNHIEQRYLFLRELESAFNHAVGDTRRPINEVTLWDWGSATASLWKAIAARYILENQTDGDLKWRILSINSDGLSFLERAPTLGDLVGRQAALQLALDDVRKLLEVTYPLGNEVYRDENGSAFVVPALDGDDADGNRLRGLIKSHILNTLSQSELGGELQPYIHITQADKQAAVLHKALATPPPPVAPFQDSLSRWWQGEATDVCTVCGVRPQGWGAPNDNQRSKAQGRNVCYICLERRGVRAKIWAQARNKTGAERKPWERTIWLDEVADENGRLALLVGKFDLSQWLNGDLVQTLLVVCDPANSRYEPKNPSFARLQRVWRTTQQFWQTVQDEDIPTVSRLRPQYRLSIAVTNADELSDVLGDYHTYDAEINGRTLSVVWDSQDRLLLTADNLVAWVKTDIESQPDRPDDGARERRLANKLLASLPDEIPLFEPGGYRQRRRVGPQVRIDRQRSEVFTVAYAPITGLLAEPNAFMALVPAAVALDTATKIVQRYELEMSKVRNRLPLFLGMVFFDRRQPLFSALDAGRRLLKRPFSSVECEVTNNQSRLRRDAPDHLSHAHFEQWQEMQLETASGEILTWRVSTSMGDGMTPDEWYPYVHVLRDKDGNLPVGRQQFTHPKHPDQHWVHVRDVQPGDTVRFVPSQFTWLHLDTSARRFEAGNSEKIHPLEELARITALWQKVKNLAAANRLSESQWHGVITLLITKRQMWDRDAKEFIAAVLAKEGLAGITIEDVTSGRLQATFELYSRILKQKLK